MKAYPILAGVLTAAALAASPAMAIDGPPIDGPMAVVLTGAAEVPGPGDDAASGTATVSFDETGKVCVAISTTGLSGNKMAHIHKGDASVAGPVAVGLASFSGDDSTSCHEIDVTTSAMMAASPANFYINVHTAAFPAGAIRGQLGK